MEFGLCDKYLKKAQAHFAKQEYQYALESFQKAYSAKKLARTSLSMAEWHFHLQQYSVCIEIADQAWEETKGIQSKTIQEQVKQKITALKLKALTSQRPQTTPAQSSNQPQATTGEEKKKQKKRKRRNKKSKENTQTETPAPVIDKSANETKDTVKENPVIDADSNDIPTIVDVLPEGDSASSETLSTAEVSDEKQSTAEGQAEASKTEDKIEGVTDENTDNPDNSNVDTEPDSPTEDTQLSRTKSETPEYSKFTELNKADLVAGDTWYILSHTWYNRWEQYVTGQSDTTPGTIDNSDIILTLERDEYFVPPEGADTQRIIQPERVQGKDFLLVSTPAYEFLTKKYAPEYTTVIQRSVINVDEAGTYQQLEITLMPIQISIVPVLDEQDQPTTRTIYMSRKKTITDLKKTLLPIVSLENKPGKFDLTKSRLYKTDGDSIYDEFVVEGNIRRAKNQLVHIEGATLLMNNVILEDAMIAETDVLVMEFPLKGDIWRWSDKPLVEWVKCGKKGRWQCCSGCKQVHYCGRPCQVAHYKTHKMQCKGFLTASVTRSYDTQGGKRGVMGLQNLGNTCFMAAAIQCLSHTVGLSEYFMQGLYKEHLNTNNPIGAGGRIAMAYTELIRELWLGNARHHAPWNIKRTLAQYAPQFVGYQQHDSQEFLSYLIDGLHEDLNQILKKPMVEQVEGFGRSDTEAAAEAWTNHLLRNKSIIVDLMHGQVKSKLECPTCGRVSITYDPFLTFTLPLANVESKKLQMYFVKKDTKSHAAKLEFMIQYCTKIGEIRKMISDQLEIPADSFLITAVKDNDIRGLLQDSMEYDDVKTFTIFCYEHEEYDYPVRVLMRDIEKGYYGRERKSTVSYTRIVFAKKETTSSDLTRMIFNSLHNYLPTAKDLPIEQLPEEYERMIDNQSFPYVVNLVSNCESNQGYKSYEKCIWCGTKGCSNCELPDSPSVEMEFYHQKDENFALEVVWSKRFNTRALNSCVDESQPMMLGQQKKGLSLQDCLEMSQTPEVLDEDNQWYCNVCKAHVRATKTYQLFKTPEYFIIHLKRFKQRGYWQDRLNTVVDFPLEGLDMSPYVQDKSTNMIYDLYAIDNHYGGLGGGHYTAFAKNDGVWYEYDDTRVSQVKDLRSIVTHAAYILFYKRRGQVVNSSDN